MKTQNTSNFITKNTENGNAFKNLSVVIAVTFNKVKSTMVKFNKNLSICGAAAASAIRN